jgi:hypothetical protein
MEFCPMIQKRKITICFEVRVTPLLFEDDVSQEILIALHELDDLKIYFLIFDDHRVQVQIHLLISTSLIYLDSLSDFHDEESKQKKFL